MLSEEIIKSLSLGHAGFGAISLLAGLIGLIARKGGFTHRISGRIYFYSMAITIFVAIFVALMPNHKSPFLIAVGIFSAYMLIVGFRAIRFSRKKKVLFIDKVVSYLMVAVGLTMILYPVIVLKKIHIVLAVFGAIGIMLAIGDLRSYANEQKLYANWKSMHLSRMIGSYIAATTAFVVVNNVGPWYVNWFAPGVAGTILIFYWTNRISKS